MSLKAFLFSLLGSTILAWFSWVLVVQNIDPAANPDLVFLFYITLGLALVGTFTTFGLFFRHLIIKDEDSSLRHLKQSSRQAVLFSVGILGTLVLMSKDLFAWWIAIIILVIIILIEAVAYSGRTARSGYVQ